MEIFILIALCVMTMISATLFIDGVLTNRKIKVKLDEYKKEILELEDNQNKAIKDVNENLKHIHDREMLLERINNIELREFPDKLKQDFYNEVIYTNDYSYYSTSSLLSTDYSISSLLSTERFKVSNKILEKIIDIYSKYCEKLHTLEKYSQKEKPVKRPVGRPRKEK